MAWFDLPPAILRAYAAAVPTIRAAESLTTIADARVGSLPVRKSAAMSRARELERAATAHRRARPANQQRLRAAGIRVLHVKAGTEVSTDG